MATMRHNRLVVAAQTDVIAFEASASQADTAPRAEPLQRCHEDARRQLEARTARGATPPNAGTGSMAIARTAIRYQTTAQSTGAGARCACPPGTM